MTNGIRESDARSPHESPERDAPLQALITVPRGQWTTRGIQMLDGIERHAHLDPQRTSVLTWCVAGSHDHSCATPRFSTCTRSPFVCQKGNGLSKPGTFVRCSVSFGSIKMMSAVICVNG